MSTPHASICDKLFGDWLKDAQDSVKELKLEIEARPKDEAAKKVFEQAARQFKVDCDKLDRAKASLVAVLTELDTHIKNLTATPPSGREEEPDQLRTNLATFRSELTKFKRDLLSATNDIGDLPDSTVNRITARFIGGLRKLEAEVVKQAKAALKEPADKETEIKLPPTKFATLFAKDFGASAIPQAFLVALQKIDENDDFERLEGLVTNAEKTGKAALADLKRSGKAPAKDAGKEAEKAAEAVAKAEKAEEKAEEEAQKAEKKTEKADKEAEEAEKDALKAEKEAKAKNAPPAAKVAALKAAKAAEIAAKEAKAAGADAKKAQEEVEKAQEAVKKAKEALRKASMESVGQAQDAIEKAMKEVGDFDKRMWLISRLH